MESPLSRYFCAVFSCQDSRGSLASLEKHYHDLEVKDQQLRKQDAKLRAEKQELRKIVDTRKAHRANITTREKRFSEMEPSTFGTEIYCTV